MRQAMMMRRARRPFFKNSMIHMPMPIQNSIKPISRFIAAACLVNVLFIYIIYANETVNSNVEFKNTILAFFGALV
jgi:hypothetical protein